MWSKNRTCSRGSPKTTKFHCGVKTGFVQNYAHFTVCLGFGQCFVYLCTSIINRGILVKFPLGRLELGHTRDVSNNPDDTSLNDVNCSSPWSVKGLCVFSSFTTEVLGVGPVMSGLNQKVLSVFQLLPAFTFFFPSFGLIHLNVPLPSYSCLHSATFHHSSSSWTISSLVLRSCHQTRMLDLGQFDSGQSRMAEGAVEADHMQSNGPQGRSTSDRMCVMACEESASERLRIQDHRPEEVLSDV